MPPLRTDTFVAGTSEKSGRWVLLASVLAASMVFIDGTALNVALPGVQADLGATGPDLFWINNAYALILAALLLFGGALGDRCGRKRIYMTGIFLFAAASLCGGFAPTPTCLIAARAMQGVGGALMIPGGIAMIADTFGPDQRGKAIGTWSAFTVIASAVGPVLGGMLADGGRWRGVFFLNLPLSLVALIVLRFKVSERRDAATPKHVDYLGALLATIGLAAINYGLIQAPVHGLAVWQTLLSLSIGIAALILFVTVEVRTSHALLPIQLFQSRILAGASILTLCFYAALHGMLFFLPLNLIQVQGYSATAAGLTQLPLMIGLACLSRWAGGLMDRFGPRLPLTWGPAVAGLGFFLFTRPEVTEGAAGFWKNYFPALLLLGLGMGITVAPLSTAVISSVPSNRIGVASGINSTLSRLSGVLAIAILGPMALMVFSRSLQSRTLHLHLAADARVVLVAEATKLGEAKAPPSLTETTRLAVEGQIKLAFVDVFRLVAISAAGLSWLSAAIAMFLMDGRRPNAD